MLAADVISEGKQSQPIKKLRDMIERGEIGKGMIDSGESCNAGSVRVRYVLKSKPWVITIEAKRHGHSCNEGELKFSNEV